MSAGGVYIKNIGLLAIAAVVLVIMIVEGLLIGLIGRPACEPLDFVTASSAETDTSIDTTASTMAPTVPWANIRLPDNLIPIKYNVDLRPVLTKNTEGKFVFFGTSTTTYKCTKPTEYVIMHSLKLEFTQSDVKITSEGTQIEVKSLSFYEPNEFVVVEIEKPCKEGKIYQFTVAKFSSELENDLYGLYRSEYDSSEGVHKVIASSMMAPTGARETFPCFDEPALKANFTVTLWYKANSGHFALSNMPAKSYKTAMFDGELWNSTTFEESVPMSSYLLALAVCDFSYNETFSKNKIQTRVYARKETVENHETDYAASIAPKILDFFERYFNVPYPLPKSDQMAVPDFDAGAMENWGLVMYRESYLLFDEALSSVFDKRLCTNVVAHELAHQWFGNLVTPAWWDDVWLKEGFASYVSYLGEKEVQPTWKSMEQFLIVDFHVAMEVDGLTSSHPLVQPVNSPSEIASQYDDISYGKGVSIVRMINAFMGESNFVTGLKAYLDDLAYGAATHEDLFDHWEDQATAVKLELPADLTDILETWTLQMGFPVINVVRTPGMNAYSITQDYFLLDPSATPVQTPGSEKYGYQWYVPFTYKTHGQIGTTELSSDWLSPDSQPLRIFESEYILANIETVGYYRVNYDEDTWRKLISHLKSPQFEEIPVKNRVQLIDDAFNLARPGRLDITVAMNMSLYLTHEEEYIPWKTFMNRIKFVEYMIGRSPVFGTFSNYVVQLVEPSIYLKYGWKEPDLSDSAAVERMTTQLGIQAACYYGSEDCIKNATRLYKEWMRNPESPSIISNTYRKDVYCAAIRNGGVDEWNFAWERHKISSNAQEKASLRYGMACSKEPWILSRYLEYCIDPALVRNQDSLRTCLQYIGSEEYGRDLAWAFMVDNWDMLVDTYGSGLSFDSFIEVITRRFSTEFDLQLLEDFKESTSNLGSAVRAVDQAIGKTKANIKWREINEEKLNKWLIDHTDNVV